MKLISRKKCQSSYVLKYPICHFGSFVSMHPFQNFLFGPITFCWVLWKTFYVIMLKKCLKSYPTHPCTYQSWENKLNYFKLPSQDFKNSFLFQLPIMILEAWQVELESAYSFGFQSSEKIILIIKLLWANFCQLLRCDVFFSPKWCSKRSIFRGKTCLYKGQKYFNL